MSHQVHLGIFEWDFEKEQENITKHGLSFSEAALVFKDPFRNWERDHKHSKKEERWLCFGNVNGRIVTVRVTFRGPYIRILGAGFWRKGRKIYEKENPKK